MGRRISEQEQETVLILTWPLYASDIRQTVVGRFDPNDKSVNHDRIDVGIEGNALEYVIRFQNTGIFPATFIEVIDTLENELDIRTWDPHIPRTDNQKDVCSQIRMY